jgi:predicted hydrocarbon binding protein
MEGKTERIYEFSWDLIGDIELGRPNLGRQTRLEVYRLMQFCFRDTVEKRYGTEEADRIFYESGRLAGRHFYDHLIGDVGDINAFFKKIQEVLKDLQIGIFRVEEADPEKGIFVVTVSEDIDCSGLPELDYEICKYDEGFLAALFERFFGMQFQGKEIDCWCSGDRTCRFEIQAT